jgi:uncharacterized protein involved in response to NO
MECSACADTPASPAAKGGAVFIGAPTISAVAPARARKGGHPVLRDSFRPFYFAGSIFAALAVPLWLGMWYHGYLPPSLAPMLWHMHEMVFGFVVAIVVGFLFTAARNWTGLPLPAGASLGAIFGLWVAGRLGMFFSYGPATAVVDSLLLIIVASVLAAKFIRARSLCSMPLVGVLLLLASANIAFHASMHGLIGVNPATALQSGLMLIVLIELIVGGRVIPGFTANAIHGVRQYRRVWLKQASFILTAAVFVADTVDLPAPWVAILALLASVAVGAQAIGWNPLAARSRPILWVLHLAYAWIPVGLVLLGLASLGVVPRSASLHAFAAGSMGGLIMGMITRTALGHSGRPVRAGRPEVASYVLVHLAAALRVTAALVPAFYFVGIAAAGLCWTAAFLTYAITYAPVLLGRPLEARAVRGFSPSLVPLRVHPH